MLTQDLAGGRAPFLPVVWALSSMVTTMRVLYIQLQNFATLQFGIPIESACFLCFSLLLLGSTKTSHCLLEFRGNHTSFSLLFHAHPGACLLGTSECSEAPLPHLSHRHAFPAVVTTAPVWENSTQCMGSICYYVLVYSAVCSVVYMFFLVRNCYFFSYIFAWKPHDFQSYSNSEGGVFFPFREDSHFPW